MFQFSIFSKFFEFPKLCKFSKFFQFSKLKYFWKFPIKFFNLRKFVKLGKFSKFVKCFELAKFCKFSKLTKFSKFFGFRTLFVRQAYGRFLHISDELF